MDQGASGFTKKLMLSLAVIVSFLAYVVRHKTTTTAEAQPDTTNDVNTSSPSASGLYRDGTYTGPVTDAFYGDFQVQAIIKGGRLSSVVVLKYPDDRPNSIAINQRAIPVLTRQAITAQSADIDLVSGATQSADAYRQSLAAALREASN